jgi:hypothetical protein
LIDVIGMGNKIYNLGKHKCAKLFNFRRLEEDDAENEKSVQEAESSPRSPESHQFSPFSGSPRFAAEALIRRRIIRRYKIWRRKPLSLAHLLTLEVTFRRSVDRI